MIIRTTELASAQEKLNELNKQKRESLERYSTDFLLHHLQDKGTRHACAKETVGQTEGGNVTGRGIYVTKIIQELEFIKIDAPNPPKMNVNAFYTSTLGVTEPQELSDKPRRLCKNCGECVNHDSGNCLEKRELQDEDMADVDQDKGEDMDMYPMFGIACCKLVNSSMYLERVCFRDLPSVLLYAVVTARVFSDSSQCVWLFKSDIYECRSDIGKSAT
ncbi:hypothetical protein Tco_1309004 [Tanacetum coccineum]